MSASARSIPLPADPLERRRLWRLWIHSDPPAAANGSARQQVRRVSPRAGSRPQAWLDEVIDAPEPVIAGLRRAVAESMTDGGLRPADRTRLIARCERLGLTRFEANLLIAAVVHRTADTAARVDPPAPRRSGWTSWRVAAVVGGVLAVEAGVIVAWLHG